MKQGITKMTAVAVAVSVLAGCTTPTVYKIEKEHKALTAESKGFAETAKVPEPIEYVTKSSELYFAGKSFAITKDELPPVFRKKVTVFRELDSMQGVMDRISALSGLRVQYQRNATATTAMPATAGAMGAAAPMPLGSPMGQNMGMNQMTALMPSPYSFTLNYEGPLEGLLNFLTTKYGYYWRYKDGMVQLYETDTRTYELVALPGGTNFESSVGLESDSKGAQEGEGASQSTSSTAKSNVTADATFDFWKKLVASVRPMMTKKGEIEISQATGMLVVTDTPEVLDKVGTFIDAQNRILSRQVSISVKVIAVENNDGDNYGINWTAVRSTLSDKFNVKLNTGLNLGTLPTMTLDLVSGNYTGSQALIGALSEKHKVSAVTSASAVTLNNHPVPITVGTQRAYLKSMTTTTDATTGSKSYTLEPGTVRFGTTMNFLPKILADNTVNLQFGIDMTDMIGDFKVFGPEGNQIQLAELDSKTFLQRASLKSGETLILAGYEDSKGMSDRQGVGSADLPILGGQIKGNSKKKTLVIMIQPVVMDTNK